LSQRREPPPPKNARALSPQELAALKPPSNQIIARKSTQPGNVPSNVTHAEPLRPDR
jgi:hypothetical protein